MSNTRKAWMIVALAGSAAACAPAADPMDTPDPDPSMMPDTTMMVDTMTTMPPDTPRVELR